MKIFLSLLSILLIDCSSKKTDLIKNTSIESPVTTLVDSLGFLTTKDLTPSSFLNIMQYKGNHDSAINVVTMYDDFPDQWVDSSDIDSLLTLIESKQKCYCFLNPLSSYIPFDDSADLGGYAIRIIKAYKENTRVSFGLYSCPKTNEKEVKELNKWWASQK